LGWKDRKVFQWFRETVSTSGCVWTKNADEQDREQNVAQCFMRKLPKSKAIKVDELLEKEQTHLNIVSPTRFELVLEAWKAGSVSNFVCIRQKSGWFSGTLLAAC
jgi:hypothetical protein